MEREGTYEISRRALVEAREKFIEDYVGYPTEFGIEYEEEEGKWICEFGQGGIHETTIYVTERKELLDLFFNLDESIVCTLNFWQIKEELKELCEVVRKREAYAESCAKEDAEEEDDDDDE